MASSQAVSSWSNKISKDSICCAVVIERPHERFADSSFAIVNDKLPNVNYSLPRHIHLQPLRHTHQLSPGAVIEWDAILPAARGFPAFGVARQENFWHPF